MSKRRDLAHDLKSAYHVYRMATTDWLADGGDSELIYALKEIALCVIVVTPGVLGLLWVLSLK